jgi:hypothetical protein
MRAPSSGVLGTNGRVVGRSTAFLILANTSGARRRMPQLSVSDSIRHRFRAIGAEIERAGGDDLVATIVLHFEQHRAPRVERAELVALLRY